VSPLEPVRPVRRARPTARRPTLQSPCGRFAAVRSSRSASASPHKLCSACLEPADEDVESGCPAHEEVAS
jgi:hypothetical protein